MYSVKWPLHCIHHVDATDDIWLNSSDIFMKPTVVYYEKQAAAWPKKTQAANLSGPRKWKLSI